MTLAALLLMWALLASHRPSGGGRAVGTPLPPLRAAGWLNGPAPKPGEFDGKVLVVDVWATWCGPCRDAAPEMVHLYEKYHDQGVEFIGLTGQTAEELPDLERFQSHFGIKWRSGYGVEQTLIDLEAEGVPMIWITDREHRIVWNYASPTTLEAGIRHALNLK